MSKDNKLDLNVFYQILNSLIQFNPVLSLYNVKFGIKIATKNVPFTLFQVKSP